MIALKVTVAAWILLFVACTAASKSTFSGESWRKAAGSAAAYVTFLAAIAWLAIGLFVWVLNDA